jgi:hypothetical protein
MTTNNSSLEAKQFIEALFSRYFTDHDGYVELRIIGETTVSKWLPKGEMSETDWDDVMRFNRTHPVFVGVNPRPLSKEKKEKDFQSIICLWADVDGKDFARGKDEALGAIYEFPIPPNIIVDSGHGYHLYWLLEKPISVVDEQDRLTFKQVLSGVIKKLGADKSKIPVCSLLRFPGTYNIKDDLPQECRLLLMEPDLRYKLEDFLEFRDEGYSESNDNDEPLPTFGEKNIIVTQGDPTAKEEERKASAIAAVERLEIPKKIKRHIITGELRTEKGKDHTRSGRDLTIIYWLVYADYDYETIKSVFFNPYLGCSNRIRQEGEKSLREDTAKALKHVQTTRIEGTPQMKRLLEIKKSGFIPREDKPYQINAFVVTDLLRGDKAAGSGYKKRASDLYYFFDREEKVLMDLESVDFYLFMRQRYGLLGRDFEEIKDAVKTEIRSSHKEVEPRKLAHFDDKNYVLYVSNHDNLTYRLDGEKIDVLDNGADGVFFESYSKAEPYEFRPGLEVTDYFCRTVPEETIKLRRGGQVRLPARESLGLSLEKFKDSYLDRFLISRAHFGTNEKNDLEPSEQGLLLTLYRCFSRASS